MNHPPVHAFLAHPSALMALLGFVLLLAPLVLIHEAGHYLVARACGVGGRGGAAGGGGDRHSKPRGPLNR